MSGRALGLDLGSVRIGVAVTDPGRVIASPHDVVTRGNEHAVEGADQQAQFCGELVFVSGRQTEHFAGACGLYSPGGGRKACGVRITHLLDLSILGGLAQGINNCLRVGARRNLHLPIDGHGCYGSPCHGRGA